MANESSPEMVVGVKGRGGLLRLLAFVVLAAAGLLLAKFTPLGRYVDVDTISRLGSKLGYWGPVVILAVGVISPLFFVPRWPVAFVSGLLYGVMLGTLLANVASTLGAWLHFLLAKSLLSPLADRLRQKYGIRDVAAVPRDKTFFVLFFLRAFPLSNFVATNLLAGALKIPLGTYLAASFFGMIPSTIMYAAWGKLMKKPSPQLYILAVVTLLVLAVGTWLAQKYFYPWFKRITGHRDD